MSTTASSVHAPLGNDAWTTALHAPSAAMMAGGEREVRVRIQTWGDIVAARRHARALATRAGFSHSTLTIIATAVSEVARNIVEYAREGEVVITLVDDVDNRGVAIVASDQGPGIADLSIVMRGAGGTGQGLGIGLPGARRLMDEFEIASEMGKGTTVTMKKWVA